jgi:hypothetical protein
MSDDPPPEDGERAAEGTETLLAQIEEVLADTRAEIARAEQLIKTIRKIRTEASAPSSEGANAPRS